VPGSLVDADYEAKTHEVDHELLKSDRAQMLFS
jgi:hypothetical protein